MTSRIVSKRMLLIVTGLSLTLSSFAQSIIKGNVTDGSGQPIIGATIQIKGQQGGTVTDINGNYALPNVKPGTTLVFSYIGYKNVTMQIDGKTNIDVRMQEDNQLLDEIVVVGYAVGTKRTVSGAIENINEADMNKGVIVNAADQLKGKVSGVVISQSGGDPAATPSIRVRGTSSLSGGNDPLVIIDGVYSDMAMFNSIQPNDIKSMTILKDASETAQYGSRGAAGVIVVTTKKGRSGEARISYNGTFGINSVFKNLDMLDADTYRKTANNLKLSFQDLGGNTNWINEIERSSGITQNHDVSFSSGNDNGNYRASLGYIQRQGVLRNSDMQGFNAKFDATQYAFNKKLKLELGVLVGKRKNKIQYDMQRIFYSAAAYNPTYPNSKNAETGIWDEDLLAHEIYNPLGQLEIKDNWNSSNNVIHGKATWTITDGLFLSAFGSYTKYNIEQDRYLPNNIRQGEINGNGWATIDHRRRDDLMGNVQLTYTKDFGPHHIDALAVAEGQRYKTFWSSSSTRGFDTNFFGYNNMKAGSVVSWGDNQSRYLDYTLSSYMVRGNYVYSGRYIVTANIRTDGSSKLGNGHKWGWFPSASAAWVLSQESFMKDIKWIDNLKLRMGYGVTGNQDAIDPYNSLELYSPVALTPYNGSNVTTFAVQSNDNPDLKWEVKHTFDVGLDFSAFDSRLNITLDWYKSKTKDLLYTYAVPVPPFTYNTLLANIGEMTNSGLELGIRGDIVRTKDFTFNSGLNLSFQKNTLNSLSGNYKGEKLTTAEHIPVATVYAAGLTQNNGVTYLIEGQPIGVFYLPHCEGIDEKGKYKLTNLNGDDNIDTGDSGDRQICGQAIPKVYLGWDFTFNYKNWALAMQFNGAFGHKIYNGTSMTYSNMSSFPTYNVLADAPAKKINDIQISDYWLEKGDYVNFEYINLSYTFDKTQLKTNLIQSLRLGFSVNNVCTFTGYKGLTPMINSVSLSKQTEGTGIYGTLGVDDKRIYPLTRTYSLNVAIDF
uniref:SusC/RagA family TonB-linked outer membrane protein n=1 Tax=Prevotella sp. GTC17259 TaxID=3236795 RepID=A0AB33JAV9_9BACT